jgi:cytochrome c556
VKQFIIGVAAAAALAGIAYAQRSAVDVIHMRQGNYKQIGAAMKGINEQMRGSAPDLAIVRRNSALLLHFAPQVLTWFPPGSGEEAGVRTRALPQIWSDRPGFRGAGALLLVATRNFDAAARSGDLARIRAAMPQVAHACANCHDTYRAEEH